MDWKIYFKSFRTEPRIFNETCKLYNLSCFNETLEKNNLEIRNVTEEKILSGEHKSDMYSSKLLTTIILKLKLFPNITWLLKKK